MSEPVQGIPEPLQRTARSWGLGGLVDDAPQVAAQLNEVYMNLTSNQRTYSAAIQIVAKQRDIPPVPAEREDGPRLFADIITALKGHYYLESEWNYVVLALFVLQSSIVLSLPAVFYLFFGGRYGSGKTNVMGVICALTDGVLLENVSIAALARIITNGKVVCIDEADVARGRDVDEAKDALIRQGYKATAAKYTRFNVNTHDVEEIPIYGPKALSFRGAIDQALLSRGFLIPTVTPVGPEGYPFVTRNLYPMLGDLPVRVRMWGKTASVEFPKERIQRIAESAEFAEKVGSAVTELGANRESELVTVALLTAEVAGLDVLEAFRAASLQRASATAEASDEGLAELTEAIVDLATSTATTLDGTTGCVELSQAAILKEVNRRRAAVHARPMSYAKLAACRRDLGIPDSWLRSVHNASRWVLEPSFVENLRAPPSGASPPPAPPRPPPRRDVKGDRGDQGDPTARGMGRPPLPDKADPGDLFGGRSTRTDLLRTKEV